MVFANMYAMGTQVSAILDIFRNLFFFIDSIVYSIIPLVYNLIYSLYDLNTLFSDNGEALKKIVSNMTVTVYSFISIFMFFRVAVSLLTMLVDPALIEDKEKGAGKIVLNIAICLVLIVVVPVLFRVAKDVQKRAMNEHWIEKMVVGEDFGTNERYTLGNELALSAWSVFLNPVEANGAVESAYNSVFNNPDSIGIGAVWPLTKMFVVLNSTSGVPILSDIVGKVFPGVNNVLNLFDAGTHYQLSYVWLLSTIVGIYIISALLKMMIDVAYRSLKFFALELLSPIAIISYIDPNSAKKGLFKKWSDEVIKTYLSLFIRIFVLAIATVLLRAFRLSDLATNSVTQWTGNTLVVKLIYVLAASAFIKNAPKMIDDLFGTTMSKDSDTKSAHQILGGIFGGAALAAAGSISGGVIAKATGKSALSGALKGGWQGAVKGYNAGKKGGVNGMVGVVEGGIGVVADQKKKYGYSVDRERERRINALEDKVETVDQAKKDAIKGLEANGEAKYRSLLRKGATYNGRKYGQGLETDDRLKNTIKKNAGGLARDEILHAGDEEYLRLRRLVYNQKNGEAMAQRTLELAQEDFQTNNSAYQNSTDKKQYVIDFIQETSAKKVDFFRGAERDVREKMAAKELGITIEAARGMSDVDLESHFTAHVTSEASARVSAVSASTSEAQLDAQFVKENGARIEATYGHSYGDIAADAAKAKGDADAANKALEDYVKSHGLGDIDSDYAVADSRHKAKKQEEERRRNGGGTP